MDSGSASAQEHVAGGTAFFGGVDLPVTQALAVGMRGPVSSGELDRLEKFFFNHNSPAVIDLCTLADPSVTLLIQQRGYAVREITNVMARRVSDKEEMPPTPANITIEAVTSGDFRAWSSVVVRGFMQTDQPPEDHLKMMSAATPDVRALLGLLDGLPSAGAAMSAHDGLATFYGDATLLRARGKGLQLAMIRYRIAEAARLGCDLVSASVLPGSTSHRNYERAGFQLVYARVMVSRNP